MKKKGDKSYSYDEKVNIMNNVFDRMLNGESVRTIIKDHKMNRSTFHQWILDHPEFSNRYTHVQQLRAHNMFDELLDICDDTSNDVIFKDGEEITNHKAINRDRLRVDTRKWALSKMIPKMYGDKLQTEISGEIKTTDFSKFTTEELLQRAKSIKEIEQNKDKEE